MIGQLSVGGTERQLLTLIEHLDRQRFSPSVISLSGNAPLADSFQQINCPLYILERERRGRLGVLWRTYQLLREIQPDIVHTFAYAARAGIPAAKFAGSARTIHAIRTDPNWQIAFWDRWLLKLTDMLLANSRQGIHSLSRRTPNLPAYRVIYNGISLSKFEIQRTKLNTPIADNAVIDGSKKIICAVARLDAVKSLDVLIRAYAQVQPEFPDTQLWLVGDGPKRGDLEILAGNLQIHDKVIFWGLRSDVPAILNHATMGVLSSKVEGLPNAIIEYMAAGLPVVATDVGGNPELVIQGETGLLVPSGDSMALSEAILYLLRNHEVACQLGEAGRNRVQENLTVERMVRETEMLYQELLDQHD